MCTLAIALVWYIYIGYALVPSGGQHVKMKSFNVSGRDGIFSTTEENPDGPVAKWDLGLFMQTKLRSWVTLARRGCGSANVEAQMERETDSQVRGEVQVLWGETWLPLQKPGEKGELLMSASVQSQLETAPCSSANGLPFLVNELSLRFSHICDSWWHTYSS